MQQDAGRREDRVGPRRYFSRRSGELALGRPASSPNWVISGVKANGQYQRSHVRRLPQILMFSTPHSTSERSMTVTDLRIVWTASTWSWPRLCLTIRKSMQSQSKLQFAAWNSPAKRKLLPSWTDLPKSLKTSKRFPSLTTNVIILNHLRCPGMLLARKRRNFFEPIVFRL